MLKPKTRHLCFLAILLSVAFTYHSLASPAEYESTPHLLTQSEVQYFSSEEGLRPI